MRMEDKVCYNLEEVVQIMNLFGDIRIAETKFINDSTSYNKEMQLKSAIQNYKEKVPPKITEKLIKTIRPSEISDYVMLRLKD